MDWVYNMKPNMKKRLLEEPIGTLKRLLGRASSATLSFINSAFETVYIQAPSGNIISRVVVADGKASSKKLIPKHQKLHIFGLKTL